MIAGFLSNYYGTGDSMTNSNSNFYDEGLELKSRYEVKKVPEATTPVPKRKGKKMDVAETIVHFAGEKAKTLKEKLQIKIKEAEDAERFIKEKTKRLRVIRSSTGNLSDKLDELVQTKRSELVAKYRRIVTQLKTSPYINKFYTDRDMRVYFVTNMLTVKKESWPKAKEAGMYEIRIDFSKGNYSDGIRILNLTQRYNEYDSPTIIDTKPCWGNLGGDMENEFNSQDLFELVNDLVDYIRSEKEANGYLGKDGDKTKGWEQFFEGAKPQPKNLNFAKYDQLMKSKEILGGQVSMSEGSASISDEIYTSMRASANQITNTTATIGWGRYHPDHIAQQELEAEQEPYRRIREGERMSHEQYDISRMLMEAGIVERASYYFMQLISEDLRSRPDYRINRVQIRMEAPEQYSILIHAMARFLIAEATESTTIREPAPAVVFRYFANTRDFNSETLEGMSRGRDRLYSRRTLIPEPPRDDFRGLREVVDSQTVESSKRLNSSDIPL